MIKNLNNWTGPITTFETLINKFKSNPEHPIVNLPSTSNNFQKMLRMSILNLVNASRSATDAKMNKVLVNVELLSFALCWYGMVSHINTTLQF